MLMEVVDVGICTYRRASLSRAIQSLGELDHRGSVRVRLIVADNDDAPSARTLAEEAAAKANLELVFVHAPARNISIARNAVLDCARAEWLAFIDDDEEVAPDWLACLMRGRKDADIIFGPVRARYRPDAPRLIREADLHTTAPSRPQALLTGYAGNVLMRLEALQREGLRFSSRFGAGGEDTVFFYKARQKGLRLGYVPDAIIHEDVPAVRESLGWLWQRRLSAGQAFGYCLHRLSGQTPLAIGSSSAIKALIFSFVTFATLVRPRVALKNASRLGFHLGVLSYCLRGSAPDPCP